MKPKTRLQKRVWDLHSDLKPISPKHREWAYNLFPKYVYRTQKHFTCLECAHKWDRINDPALSQLLPHTCPHCKKELQVLEGRKRTNRKSGYYNIIDVIEGIQLVRIAHITKSIRVGEKPEFYHHEIIQHWLTKDGKHINLSKKTGWGMFNHENKSWSGPMEIRSRTDNCYYNGEIYPAKKIIPAIRRNGHTKGFHDYHPAYHFKLLLCFQKAETLFKAKQYELYKNFSWRRRNIDTYWSQIKICIRHNYQIKDVSTWFDHLHTLEYLEMDIHNPSYICDPNMNETHVRLSDKKRKIEQRIINEKRKIELIQDEAQYLQTKQKYFGLCFGDDDLVITVLKSVEDFFQEGEELHHCVASRHYYNNDKTLIMSARYQGKRIETVEINLKDLTLIQARGLQNQPSKHHKAIIKLVKEHMFLIEKVRDFKGKTKKKKSQELKVA